MIDRKNCYFSLPAIALCLMVGPALQALAGTEHSRSDDDWEGHVSVGPAGCDYSDLQSAIDAGAAGDHGGHVGVHVDYEMASEVTIDDFSSWSNDPWIAGGFSSCNVGNLDNATSRTRLDANGQSRHFEIRYEGGETDPVYRVGLQNFELVNGNAAGAGAVWIRGQHNRVVVELSNTEIDLNDGGFFGGGIYVQPDETIVDFSPAGRPIIRPMLILDDDTDVTRNQAVRGGGISCIANSDDEIQGTVVRAGGGLVFDNVAGVDGGGVHASNCNLSLHNGDELLLFIPSGGIAFNTAAEQGGGIHAEGGAQIRVRGASIAGVGDPDHAALVFGNEAPVGAGIHATGAGTEVWLQDTFVVNNSAAERGGGIYVTDEAAVEFEARELEEPCSAPVSDGGVVFLPRCNRLADNSAGVTGGAAQVVDGGQLLVHDTYIEDNSAGWGSVAKVRNSADFGAEPVATLVLENSLVTGNSGGDELFRLTDEARVEVWWSTIAGNQYADDSGRKFTMATVDHPLESTLEMTGVILWNESDEVDTLVRGPGAKSATLTCGIGFESASQTSLTDVGFYSHIDPEFQNPEAGNYQLSPDSPAIDYCNDQTLPERDLDGRLRDVVFGGDTIEAPNPHPDGIHDLGAFTGREDGLFRDRFEAD